MLQSQMSSREGRRQSALLFTLQDHVLFDHACHLAISQLDGLFSPPKRDMGKALNEAADQLVRNAAQGPVPLPTAGRAAACHEHSCHLEVSTLSQPHGDRKKHRRFAVHKKVRCARQLFRAVPVPKCSTSPSHPNRTGESPAAQRPRGRTPSSANRCSRCRTSGNNDRGRIGSSCSGSGWPTPRC